MAAKHRQYLTCKRCGQKFTSSDKSVLCGGKCKSLFHLKCIPLNKAERSVLSVSRNLWWLCDLCSNVDPGSIVSVLSGLISTISVLNKEISSLKEVVKCSHSSLRNGKSAVEWNCSCHLSNKRKVSDLNHNSNNLCKHTTSSSLVLDTPRPIEVKQENVSPGNTSTDLASNVISNSQGVNSMLGVNEIKSEPEDLHEATSAPIVRSLSKRIKKEEEEDTNKYPKRSKRHTYKVNEFYYY